MALNVTRVIYLALGGVLGVVVLGLLVEVDVLGNASRHALGEDSTSLSVTQLQRENKALKDRVSSLERSLRDVMARVDRRPQQPGDVVPQEDKQQQQAPGVSPTRSSAAAAAPASPSVGQSKLIDISALRAKLSKYPVLRQTVAEQGLATGWSPKFKKSSRRGSSNKGVTLPNMRPPPEKRTFRSEAVDSFIDMVYQRIPDPNLAMLWYNCLPSTIDTTVWKYDLEKPDAFVVTGDIYAQWLRDSTNQVLPYVPFVKEDPNIERLVCGLIKRQTRDLLHDVYANAFNYADKVAPGEGGHMSDRRKPRMTPHVFEGKYELDSLGAAMKLAWEYYIYVRRTDCFDKEWLDSIKLYKDTIIEQQKGTDEEGDDPAYTFKRDARELVGRDGRGPRSKRNGLSKCGFRPSDDACKLPFLIPSNAMAVVELRHMAELVAAVLADRPSREHSQLPKQLVELADELELAIYVNATVDPSSKKLNPLAREPGQDKLRADVTIAKVPEFKRADLIFAYEVDGLGKTVINEDDPNVPSLLSLPYLGFVDAEDNIYKRTRAHYLSKANKYFHSTDRFSGIVASQHTGMSGVWPMSLIMRTLTTTEPSEIPKLLRELVDSSAGTGLLHESFRINSPGSFTRVWFAWANDLFGTLVLKLADEHPNLLFEAR